MVSDKLVKIILGNPEELEKIEWRQMERLIADILDEIGYKVELTSGSNDGGKDIIFRCKNTHNNKSYIIEIKHWASRQKVGYSYIRKFLNVIINEEREKGLFLSTYGFCDNAFETFTEFEMEKLEYAEKEKIIKLCGMYRKKRYGIWIPSKVDIDLLFDNTK